MHCTYISILQRISFWQIVNNVHCFVRLEIESSSSLFEPLHQVNDKMGSFLSSVILVSFNIWQQYIDFIMFESAIWCLIVRSCPCSSQLWKKYIAKLHKSRVKSPSIRCMKVDKTKADIILLKSLNIRFLLTSKQNCETTFWASAERFIESEII